MVGWLRFVVFRRRASGRHTRTSAPVAPPASSRRLAPSAYGARLVVARRHRAERRTGLVQGEAWQPQAQGHAEWFPPRPGEEAGALVRPYVAALGVTPRSARAGARGACGVNVR
jgi:hypothetical protein